MPSHASMRLLLDSTEKAAMTKRIYAEPGETANQMH
jgi:hypothetical protein